MKIYKCDICGKAVERPSEIMYTCSQCIGYPNKIEMYVVHEDGSASTDLSFDICKDCGKKLYSSLTNLENTDGFWSFKHGKESDESTNKSDA
jgi:hypothetical protein